MISDPKVAFNTLQSDDFFSSDTPSSSLEEVGPTSLNLTVTQSVEEVRSTFSKEAGPTSSSKVGPTLLQGTNSAFDTTRSVSLSQSMSSYVDTLQSVSDDIDP